MNNARVSRRGLGLGAAGAALLLASGCSSSPSQEQTPAAPSVGGSEDSGNKVLTVAYNEDGPHKSGVEAVCESISAALGVAVEPLPFPSIAELSVAIVTGTVVGAFWVDRRADYPTARTFLGDQYRTGARGNSFGYASFEFDTLLNKAATADEDEAGEFYEDAQRVLLGDLPAVPLWYRNGFGGYSSRVSDVSMSWNMLPLYEAITTTGDDGVVRASGTEPQNPLVPAKTNEMGGGRVLDLLFSGLVRYKRDGSVVNEMADSIETDDNRHFTVKIEDGWTFADGTAVTASSFIKSWNYGAQKSKNNLSSHFFEPIEGFSYDEDSELTGLAKVDDLTFTITLNEPLSDFPLRLGHWVFFPMPDSAFKDPGAYGQTPIGNGPYNLEAWEHNTRIVLVRNPSYRGGREVANEGVTFTIYPDESAAYDDLLSEKIDVVDAVPDSSLSTFSEDLDGRTVNDSGCAIQTVGFTVDAEHWGVDEEGRLRRAALSRAINRKDICQSVYHGTRTPASDFTSPKVPGWTKKLAGNEVLTYNANEAMRLWKKAEAISAL